MSLIIKIYAKFDVWDAKSNHIKPGKELYNVTSIDADAISSAFGVEILERFVLNDLSKEVRAPSSDKITQIRDSDEKYKKLILMLKTRTRSVSSHILKEINVINGFTPQMMDRKIFHDDYISYEDFNINDPIKRLWKRAVNYVIGSMVEKPNRTRYTLV
ncbi:20349_t:CDS:2, partial [Entrophospora sp. SA101]